MAGETDSGRAAPSAILARIAAADWHRARGCGNLVWPGCARNRRYSAGSRRSARSCSRSRSRWRFSSATPSAIPARTEGVVISAADGKVTDISDARFPGQTASSTIACRSSCRRSTCSQSRAGRRRSGDGRAYGRRIPRRVSRRRERAQRAQSDRDADAAGRMFAIMQIAGYLARRIVCRVHPHDKIQRRPAHRADHVRQPRRSFLPSRLPRQVSQSASACAPVKP